MRLEGIYKIEGAYPEANKRREGRYVIFPFEVKENQPAVWFYVHYGYNHIGEEFVGQHVSTSLVRKVEEYPKTKGNIQLSTLNSQYIFNRII